MRLKKTGYDKDRGVTPLTVVITGASSGIGLELSKRYAKKATKIYLLARREQELNILAGSLRQNNHGLSVETMAVDVTDFSKLTEVSEYICRSGEKIDILIANAGISSEHKSDIYVFSDFKKIIETNFLSIAAMCEIFAKKMKLQKSGKIVIVSSLASLVALMSKRFVLSEICIVIVEQFTYHAARRQQGARS